MRNGGLAVVQAGGNASVGLIVDIDVRANGNVGFVVVHPQSPNKRDCPRGQGHLHTDSIEFDARPRSYSVSPPSTVIVCPVTIAAPNPRKTTTSAKSSG
mgnify:CR=1 FL=1